jgi:hypothetical protein
VTGVDCGAPCEQSWGEEGGVNKSDAVCKSSVGNEGMCHCGRSEGLQVKVPEAGGGSAGAREQQSVAMVNVEAGG